MPNINEELSQMLDPHKNTLRGVVGLTESVIKVTNRASFVWVRLLDNLSEAIQAYNRTVNPVYNLPVILKFDGTKYEIISVDANRYTQWNSVQAYLPEHGMQHSAMYGASGNDIVWVDQKQFLPLLATPTGGTGTNVVGIVPYTFRNSQGNWIFAGNTGVICPPSIMATGSTIQLLCLQDSDGMPYFKAGTPFVGSISGTPAFLPYLPTVLNNNNDIPIAAIIRTGNVTGTPLGWPDFIDVRQFYKGYVSAPTGSSSYLETFKVSISGTLIGNANEIDLYGNFSGTIVGNKVKIYDKSLVKVYTDTTLTGDGTQGNPLHSVTGTYLVGVTTDTSLQGNGTPGNPLKLTVTGSSGGANIGLIEEDGAPSGTSITTIVVSNGTLSISGTTAFINTVGGIPTLLQHSQAVFTIEGTITTTGTKPIRIYTPFVGSGAVIEEIYASLNTKPVASPVRVNILKNGNSILTGTMYVEILSGTNTANRTNNFISTSLNKDDYLMLEVVRGDVTASDLSIHVRYKWVLMGV